MVLISFADLFTLLLLILKVRLSSCVSVSLAEKIEGSMFENGKELEDIIVTFGSTTKVEEITARIHSEHIHSTKEDRIYALYEAMHGYYTECSGKAESYLKDGNYDYKGIWSSNMMLIKKADLECVKTLLLMEDVTSISPNKQLSLTDPVENFKIANKPEISVNDEEEIPDFSHGFSWGLSKLYVKEAWKYDPENYGYGNKGQLKTGQGIVVGVIDSGAFAEHEAIKDNHRTYAGWKDGYGISDKPVDISGHGTHCTGTICGKNGIGVAPGAQWIACRGCFDFICHGFALLSCCDWMLCPHDESQGKPNDYRNCHTAPDIISNSWGGGQGETWFDRCILAWRAAGIIPVFAIGNSGPACETANSPGDSTEVISVGAMFIDNDLVYFSSKGPSVKGDLKPDFCAPGVAVTSAWITATNAYEALSGTSMACPHVSGVIALMLQRCRLGYDQIYNVLKLTAEREDLGKSAQICGNTTSSEFPNNFYGYGTVNARDAVKKIVQICDARNSHYGHGASYFYGGNGGSYVKPYQYNYGTAHGYGGRSGGHLNTFNQQIPYSYSYYPMRIPHYN